MHNQYRLQCACMKNDSRALATILVACVAGAWKVGGRENGRARGRHARSDGVSPSRAPGFSCAHFFQAPATQATILDLSILHHKLSIPDFHFLNVILLASNWYLSKFFWTFQKVPQLKFKDFQCLEKGH